MGFLKKLFKKRVKEVESKSQLKKVEELKETKSPEPEKARKVPSEKERIKKVEAELKAKGYLVCLICNRPIINHTIRKYMSGYAHDICLKNKGPK